MSSSPATHEIRCINRPGFILLAKEHNAQQVKFTHDGVEYSFMFDKNEVITWKKIHELGHLYYDNYPFNGMDYVPGAQVYYVYNE